MDRTCKLLKYEWFAMTAIALLVLLVFEQGVVSPGYWTGNTEMKFVLTMGMELATLCAIPLSLYLFRFKPVARQLTDGCQEGRSHSLLTWGSIRTALLGVPTILNVLFYEMAGLEPSFGYLAIILFLCMLMIYPSLRRCQAETRGEDRKEEQNT